MARPSLPAYLDPGANPSAPNSGWPAKLQAAIFDVSDRIDSAVSSISGFLRFDSAQFLTTAQKTQVKTNLGLGGLTIAGARTASDPVLTDAQALALYGEGSYFTVDPT